MVMRREKRLGKSKNRKMRKGDNAQKTVFFIGVSKYGFWIFLVGEGLPVGKEKERFWGKEGSRYAFTLFWVGKPFVLYINSEFCQFRFDYYKMGRKEVFD